MRDRQQHHSTLNKQGRRACATFVSRYRCFASWIASRDILCTAWSAVSRRKREGDARTGRHNEQRSMHENRALLCPSLAEDGGSSECDF